MALTLAGALIALALLALVTADGWLRQPLSRLLSAHTNREIAINGPLHTHLLTLSPGLTAEQVTVGNPPWSTPGTMARIRKLTIAIDLHPFAIRLLQLEGLDLNLQRSIDGRANWYWKSPGTLPGKGAPLVYSLSVPQAHVTLHDARRHLDFNGTLKIKDAAAAAERLGMELRGDLNGREVDLRITGDPLARVARNAPYHFSLEERSSGSDLTGEGALLQPFDFRLLEATFAGHGADLHDLYFLLGTTLPHTGPYHLSGKLIRHYTTFTLEDLLATAGESDVRGTIVSEMFPTGKSHVNIDLHSRRLRIADLTPQHGTAPRENEPLLLSPAEMRVEGLRHNHSQLTFQAREIEAGPLTFHSVAGDMSVDYGQVNLSRLSASLPDGRLAAHGKLDARPDTPTASLHLEISDVRAGQLFRKNPAAPPLDGTLNGHVTLTGRGRSLHAFAASANGTVTLTMRQGVMRASLAELAGANLRGLKLMLAHSRQETPIRCGMLSLQARNGALLARELLIDTDRMQISGTGAIQLGTETLDLRIQGEPKGLRLLRLSGPLSVQGTLRHPTVRLDKHNRTLELIDPGHGRDVDCRLETTQASAVH